MRNDDPANAIGVLERLLRSGGGRLALAVGGVSFLSVLGLLGFRETFGGRESWLVLDEWAYLQRQLVRWGLWAAVALFVIVPLLRWSSRQARPRQVAAHLVLGALSVAGWGQAWNAVRDQLPNPIDFGAAMQARESARQAERGEQGPEEGRPPRPAPFDEEAERGPRRRPGRFGRGPRGEEAWMDHALTYLLLLLLCSGGAAYVRAEDSRRRSAGLEVERAGLFAELTEARLSSLEAQLRPHFLFNALHSVGALIRMGRAEEAHRALTTLGDLLRSTLDRSGEGRSTLREELELCGAYLDLEALRYGDKLSREVDLPSELEDVPIAHLLLLPLVENAVRHGVGPSTDPVHIQVTCRDAGDRVSVVVQDNGPPFPEEVLQRGHGDGIGLSNTRQRLANLYGEAGHLELTNEHRMATASLEWPK